MNKLTVGDVRTALNKKPEDRSEEEAAAVEEWEQHVRPLMHSMASRLDRERLRTQEVLSGPARLLKALAPLELPAWRALLREPPPLNMDNLYPEGRWEGERAARDEERRDLLTKILERLEKSNDRLDDLEQRSREHSQQIEQIRTGAPGRPTAMYLVLEEFDRRVKSENLEGTVSEQARSLAEWLSLEHSRAPHLKPRSIENKIRGRYHRARSRASKVQGKARKHRI